VPPGDNYRVTACANVDTLAAMTWAEANVGDAPKYGQTTELLTVWRKLWVAFDMMEAPPASEMFGEVHGVIQAKDATWISATGDPGWRADCLVGGVLDLDSTSAEADVDYVHDVSWELQSNGSATAFVWWRDRYEEDKVDNDGDGLIDEEDEGTHDMDNDDAMAGDDFAIETDDVKWRDGRNPPDHGAIIAELNNTYFSPAANHNTFIICEELTAEKGNEFAWQRNTGDDIGAYPDSFVDGDASF